jgi:hypothetical protein
VSSQQLTCGSQHPSFFSDPDFPNSIYKHEKSFRIDLFQQTYEEFFGLDFTVDTDRAVAINGLESRLAKLYGSASYGLVHDLQDISYLIRSLLWQRVSQCSALVRLKYPPWSPNTIVFLDVSERADILPVHATHDNRLAPSQRETIHWLVVLVRSEIEQRISCVLGIC